ncbi:MAG: hypothetical protein AB7H80_14645 [Candidatus Kapaibacterium sp.]
MRNTQEVVSKKKLHDKESAYDYWKDRSIDERIAALEELRRQYIERMGYAERRLQRVCRVVKRK